MELKIKFLKWSAGIPVAMLNKETASEMGVHAGDRVSIETSGKNKRNLSMIIDTVERITNKKEIGISIEVKKILNLKEHEKVEVNFTPSSKSLVYIKKKLNKKRLTEKEINEIIKDVVNNSLSESEIALFISAMYKNGMDMKETIYLIKAILFSGKKLKLRGNLIVDKHSVGGIPGNRTTPIVVSICAAAGLIIPKNSSRAITSAAGTADVIEAVADVEFSIKELKKIVHKTNACMVWGGALGMVPADAKIIQIEKMLKIDPESQLLASVMAKKLAGGSKYILIDIPYGKTAKFNKVEAIKLKKKFEYLGKYFKKNLKCVLTDGSQPIGNGIGPMLELKDIILVLDPKKQGPKDLEEKSLFIAGQIFELSGKTEKGEGYSLAKEILYSGKAFDKFKEIIHAQNGNLSKIREAKFKKTIFSKKSGKILEIDNKRINLLARFAGCPIDKPSGVFLYKHVGDKIKKREPLLVIHSESKIRLKEAIDFFKLKNPYTIK